MTTIFGKIIRKEVPAQIVYEDDKALAFKDLHPAAPFHVLVIPKQEIANLGAMREEDAPLVGHLLWVCRKVALDAGCTDFRVVSNSGDGAGQSVFHLHFHVLGNRVFRWPPG
ncbi:MAG: histidine triad nucleotide-binding protein [Myxococcota bacterium]